LGPFILSKGEGLDAKKIKLNDGFTLIELLATLVILGIILAISIPSIGSVIVKAEEKACHSNQQLIEDDYERTTLYDKTGMTFSSYIDSNQFDQCPGHCYYTYIDEHITCSQHPRVNELESDPVDVPWL
jgi:type IV pilus assembly protein PilA